METKTIKNQFTITKTNDYTVLLKFENKNEKPNSHRKERKKYNHKKKRLHSIINLPEPKL